jgi:hypothetical protein
MTKDVCVQFVLKTLSLAMSRDGSSCGVVRLGIISEEGIERRSFGFGPASCPSFKIIRYEHNFHIGG